MDIKQKAKSDVLQKLIDMMDDRMVGDLKDKSPKFMKVETNDPEMAKSVAENALEDNLEENEDPSVVEHDEPQKEEEDDEDLQRLLEMYSKLK